MSYKTNPISNRLKIIKGWKNPYLPTKTLNYSRDIALWFKVYLLLKTFLNLKKIQLLSCEIRFEQQNKKLLYLVINKKKTQRKKRKKTRISLKKLQTPIRKSINKNSIFFLYKNLKFLKQISFWNQNVVQKKILSKFWLTKPKISNFLNYSEKITKLRQISKKMKFLQKNKVFIPTQHLKIQFYTNKQKQLLTQKLRINKINTLLFAKLLELSQQKNAQILKKFHLSLKEKIAKNQAEIKKINTISAFLFRLNQNALQKPKKTVFSKKFMRNRLQKHKWTLLQKMFKKELTSFRRAQFFKKKLPTFLWKLKKNRFSRGFQTNQILSKKILLLNFLTSHFQNKSSFKDNHFLISQLQSEFGKKKNRQKPKKAVKSFHTKSFLKSKLTRIRRKKQLPYRSSKTAVWFLLRLKKKKKRIRKKKVKMILKKRNFRLKKKDFQKQISFWNAKKYQQIKAKSRVTQDLKKINAYAKKSQVVKTYKYRLPYRKSYFQFLQFMTKFQLKYLIQDFVKKYFFLNVEAKVIHFLNEQKNQNYFRLVFPVWKKKKNQMLRKFRQGGWKKKQIFLTSQLQLGTTTNQQTPKITRLTNKTVKILKKKDLFLLTRKKVKNLRLKNSFKRIKNSKDFRHSFKYFIPTLMYFARTLNPQPLSDLLAKVMYKAKKQTWMLNTVKDILRMVKLGKNVGYKIALAGRINSADKSRLIYITRKNVPLQVFDKNMNFAYSQAKARIGVFGIKIWVYF